MAGHRAMAPFAISNGLEPGNRQSKENCTYSEGGAMRGFWPRLRAGRLQVAAVVRNSVRRRHLRTVAVLAIVGAVAAIAGTALAVHDEAFELDGNIDDANPAGGPEVDWDNDIVGVGANGFSAPQTSLPAGFSAATAGPDFMTTTRRGVEVAVTGDDSTFTTNSKDILDISAEWRCVHANNVTDKGDLVNTYAVAYTNASNELILYSARRRTTRAAPTTLAFGSCRTRRSTAPTSREAAARRSQAVT